LFGVVDATSKELIKVFRVGRSGGLLFGLLSSKSVLRNLSCHFHDNLSITLWYFAVPVVEVKPDGLVVIFILEPEEEFSIEREKLFNV
jgi:hypothetical protein